MRKIQLFFSMLLILIGSMNSKVMADNNNFLSIADFTAEAGSQVTIPVLMTNSEQIAAFQADLYLPDGVTLAEDEFGDGMIEIASGRTTTKRHTVSYKAQSDGAIRIVVTSPNNNVFSGTGGAVVNVTLDVSTSIAGGTHTISLNNQELTKTDLTAFKTTSKSAVLTIPGGNSGDDENPVSDNFLSIADITADAGSQITIPILMTNSEQIAAFQADLYLPDGVTLAEDEFGDGMIEIASGRTTTKRHSVSYKAQTDGAIRIAVYSPNNDVFSGTSGAVVNVTLDIADDMATGQYAIMLNNQELTKTDLTAYKTATKSASIEVSNILVNCVTLDNASLTITEGNTTTLSVTVLPENATNKDITWTSSNEDVATVEDGVVTAVAPGTATITVTTADGTELSATCEVTVNKDLSAEIAKLESLVASAQTTCTDAVEGTAVGNYNPGAKAILQAAINEVSATISVSMTEAQITEGTIKINNALEVFEAEKVTTAPTEPDTDISEYDNILYIEPQRASIGGQVEVPIMMKNVMAVTGFQFDLLLPEGITVPVEDDFPLIDLSLERTTVKRTNTFDCSPQPDGTIRVICNSTQGYAFSGNDGEVAIATLDISSELTDGDYPIIIKNLVITDATGNNKVTIEKIKSTLTLESYTLGDANADGDVDIADYSAIVAYILGHPSDNFVEKAADVNTDNTIDVADLSGLAYMILHPDEFATRSKAFVLPETIVMASNPEEYENTLYINPQTVASGSKATVPINMRNTTVEATGFQFDMYLPEGITMAEDEDGFPVMELSTERTTKKRTNTFDCSKQADGSIRVICNSTQGYAFSGSDGEVAIATLDIASDLAHGDYPIAIKNIIITDATGNNKFTVAEMSSDITVGDVTPVYTEGYGVEVTPFAITAGSDDTEVPVLMNNLTAGEISSVEFDLYLPEGVSLYEEDGEYVADAGSRFASSTIKNRFACEIEENTDGSLHFSAYFTRTTSSYVFSGISGDIMLLTLLGDENLKEGIYELEIRNIVLNDDSEIKVRPYKASIFVGKPQVEDATLYGTYNDEAVDLLNESLSAAASLTYLDMTNAKIEDDMEITLANANAIIYVKEGTQLANEDNVVVGDKCENLVLVDKKPFAAIKAFTATTATYTRTLPDGEGWNSAVLPYEFDVTDDMEVINNAVVGSSSITFTDIKTDETIPANTPFLYRYKNGGTITIENVDVDVVPAESTPASGALLGTYVAFPKGEATGKLIMTQDGQGFATASATASIPAIRAYLNGGAGSQVFTIVIGEEITGILDMGEDMGVNQEVDVYTIDGKLVRSQVNTLTALEGLESGIYIVNGNKIKK